MTLFIQALSAFALFGTSFFCLAQHQFYCMHCRSSQIFYYEEGLNCFCNSHLPITFTPAQVINSMCIANVPEGQAIPLVSTLAQDNEESDDTPAATIDIGVASSITQLIYLNMAPASQLTEAMSTQIVVEPVLSPEHMMNIYSSMTSALPKTNLITPEKLQMAAQIAYLHYWLLAQNSPYQNASKKDKAVKIWLLFKLWLNRVYCGQLSKGKKSQLMALVVQGMGSQQISMADISHFVNEAHTLIPLTHNETAATILQRNILSMNPHTQMIFHIPNYGVLIVIHAQEGQFILVTPSGQTIEVQLDQLDNVLINLFSEYHIPMSIHHNQVTQSSHTVSSGFYAQESGAARSLAALTRHAPSGQEAQQLAFGLLWGATGWLYGKYLQQRFFSSSSLWLPLLTYGIFSQIGFYGTRYSTVSSRESLRRLFERYMRLLRFLRVGI